MLFCRFGCIMPWRLLACSVKHSAYYSAFIVINADCSYKALSKSHFLSTRSVLWPMPKMRWWPGLCPGTRWGSSRRSPRPRSRLGRGTPLPTPQRMRQTDKQTDRREGTRANFIMPLPYGGEGMISDKIVHTQKER